MDDALDRRPHETDKAWRAFKYYRSLGADRSLQKAADLFYGRSGASRGQLEVWSAKHDWVRRVRSYDDWLEMEHRIAVEVHLQSRAHEFAERQAVIRERLLGIAEQACDNATKMAEWPLAEQRILKEGEGPNGEDLTLIFTPAGWNKSTVGTMVNIAAAAVSGQWATTQVAAEEEGFEYDYSQLSEAELESWLETWGKVRTKPKDGGR